MDEKPKKREKGWKIQMDEQNFKTKSYVLM
jgi:hypothetical protein